MPPNALQAWLCWLGTSALLHMFSGLPYFFQALLYLCLDVVNILLQD